MYSLVSCFEAGLLVVVVVEEEVEAVAGRVRYGFALGVVPAPALGCGRVSSTMVRFSMMVID